MTVHLWGARLSSFCATYAPGKNVKLFDPGSEQPLPEAVRTSFCLVSFTTDIEAVTVARKISELLAQGGFRKWTPKLPTLLVTDWEVNATVVPLPHTVSIELHVVFDTSGKGFGAVAYACRRPANKSAHGVFLLSTFRTAPTEPVTILRLEL